MTFKLGEYIFWKRKRMNQDTGQIYEEPVYTLVTTEEKFEDSNPKGTIYAKQLNSLHRVTDSGIYHGHMAARHEIEYMLERSNMVTYT